MTEDSLWDELETYGARYDPMVVDRRARRSRVPRVAPPRREQSQVLAELTEGAEVQEGAETTYRPSRYEEGWLQAALQPFFERGLISDVQARLRGGKEASVYRCAAHASIGVPWLAAKVYRPRKFRNLRNDALYREGRALLRDDGQEVNRNDDRILRAVGKKTAFGQQVEHTSWLMHEYTALERLYADGAAVPRPYGSGDNAILMAYLGDEQRPAPTLHEITLSSREAHTLWREVLRNVELLLQHGLIHGDLSAYNILYWQHTIALIDFPQVTHTLSNPRAEEILQRDVRRVGEYFQAQGVECDPEALASELWRRYGPPDAERAWRALPPEVS